MFSMYVHLLRVGPSHQEKAFYTWDTPGWTWCFPGYQSYPEHPRMLPKQSKQSRKYFPKQSKQSKNYLEWFGCFGKLPDFLDCFDCFGKHSGMLWIALVAWGGEEKGEG